MCCADDPVFKDHGGEPLDLVLERNKGQPLDVARFLRIAIGLTKAVGWFNRGLALGLEQ